MGLIVLQVLTEPVRAFVLYTYRTMFNTETVLYNITVLFTFVLNLYCAIS